MSKNLLATLLLATLITGSGCGKTTLTANSTPQTTTTTQPQKPTTPQTSGVTETEEPLALGDIGFTINPTQTLGNFSVALYKHTFPTTPNLGENWEFRGSLSNQPLVYYRASDPAHTLPREGYAGDVLGYKQVADGYYVNDNGGKNWTKVPTVLVVEEVPLGNGTALLIQGPEESDGPSPFPNQPGQLVAYINTPNGPLPGGVFIADPGSITIDDMKALLASVSIR